MGDDARIHVGSGAPRAVRYAVVVMTASLILSVHGCERKEREAEVDAGVGARNVDGRRENTFANSEDRQVFESFYAQLLQFRSTPEVMVSSRPEDYNDCKAFREIVAGGAGSLPFVVEKIGDGDFLMNQAMREITGVDVRKQYNDYSDGEQHESELWLRWWKENRETYRGERKKED